MAQENEDGQEKTEQPTEKKLRQAREQGQVARSRELATAAVFGMATLVLIGSGGWMARAAHDWMRHALSIPPGFAETGRGLAPRFGELLLGMLGAVSPLIGVCLLAGFIAPVAMGGIRFSAKSITPDLKKLDPLKGLKRIYGRDGLVELGKSILRVLLISGLAAAVIVAIAPRFIGLVHRPMGPAAAEGFWLVLMVMLAMGGGLLLLAAIDVPYQRWSHRRKLMMTRQELRDELKETEGRPEVKARIRRIQQELSQHRMMQAVPTADVILVNPTHYAVALKYEAGKMRAPRVVAKGVDEIARLIRESAERHAVPIVSAPPLARALYRQVRLGQEIPVTLYAAVAQILGYVYQLRAWRRHGGRMPELPEVRLPDDGVEV